MSSGHDLSEYCHVLTSSQSPGWLPSPDTSVYTRHNNKNMKILWGGEGARGRGEGGTIWQIPF